MTSDTQPDVLITVSGPTPPYEPKELLKALRDMRLRFAALLNDGLSPRAALRQVDAEFTALAPTSPIAQVLLDNRLTARVEGDMDTDGERHIEKRGSEAAAWDWVLRSHLQYVAIVTRLPELPFPKDANEERS